MVLLVGTICTLASGPEASLHAPTVVTTTPSDATSAIRESNTTNTFERNLFSMGSLQRFLNAFHSTLHKAHPLGNVFLR
jgi:hypothetical protein